MSFGGSVQAMITSLKMNKRERKTMFDKEGAKEYGGLGKLGKQNKLSPEAFEAFKKELEIKRKKDQARQRTILVLSLLITAALVVTFLLVWNA